jgi:hypothetical protein
MQHYTLADALIVLALTAGFLGYQYLKRRDGQRRLDILHAERMAAMDKGIPLPELPLDPPPSAWRRPPDPTVPLAIGIVLTAFGVGAMLMLAIVAPGRPYWAVPLPIAMMGLGLVLYYRLSVVSARPDSTTRHGD